MTRTYTIAHLHVDLQTKGENAGEFRENGTF